MLPDGQEAQKRWLTEFEYARNGTIDVFAFLHISTGNVHMSCQNDHKKKTSIAEFCAHVGEQPVGVQLDYVMDNLASHCSYDFCVEVARLSNVACPPENKLSNPQLRREWLEKDDKRIVLHFTPFHGSWLNPVEIFFRIMGQMCLKDSYDSPSHLCAALLEFGETDRKLLFPDTAKIR